MPNAPIIGPREDPGRFGTVVGEAFGSPVEPDYQYLTWLREEWRAAEQRFRRLAFLGIAAAVVFILLRSGRVAELAFGGVKLSQDGLDVILKLLPALVSLLVTEALFVAKIAQASAELASSVMNRMRPRWLHRHLDFAISPIGSTFIGLDWTLVVGRYEDQRPLDWIAYLGWAITLVMVIAPIGFLVYAYVTLVERYGGSDVLLLGSLAFSAVNAIRYCARLWAD
jgi:hypothetical protein